jgi:hypothetical protein
MSTLHQILQTLALGGRILLVSDTNSVFDDPPFPPAPEGSFARLPTTRENGVRSVVSYEFLINILAVNEIKHVLTFISNGIMVSFNFYPFVQPCLNILLIG